MSTYYSKTAGKFHRTIATGIIISILATLIPASVFAEGEAPQEGQDGSVATSTQSTSTSTDEINAPDGETASSTGSGTEGGDGTEQDGEDGTGNTPDGETSTTTATSTPISGEEGNEGTEGTNGSEGTAGATPQDEVEDVEIVSDALLGDSDAPEEAENTGEIRRSGRSTLIETGIATAQGELFTDANSNDIRSEDLTLVADRDTYTFTATGTNDAVISNDGVIVAVSGENTALGTNSAEINTADAVAAFNVANIINTNVINSDGFIYLANKILEEGQSLDLTSSFFPDVAEVEALSDSCSLLSCVAEDVIYNISQTNHATITNDALVEAVTGDNLAHGNSVKITTGDAYAAANVMNVVNSNIIDSNYRLLTYNAIGDLDGDLVLPTQELFDAFFSRPNGTNQVEDFEDVHLNVTNANEATADNNLDAFADTGHNTTTNSVSTTITTGVGESESNVLNKINENTYGGDSLYLLIRVHGIWSGDVVGLPEGLTWEWTPLGIVIYNTDAEIAPSEMLGYDVDSYTANFTNNNHVALENNITLNAITGENDMDGFLGSIKTGDAFASANVMNIANTNIVGTNWTFAVVNIMGDFDGNVSFAATDIKVAGTVVGPQNPLKAGDSLTYTYTVTNMSSKTASNVILEQTLQNAHTNANSTTQFASLGTLLPGESKQKVFSAIVDSSIPYGTTTISAYATVESDQGDSNIGDNLLLLNSTAVKAQPYSQSSYSSGTTTSPYSQSAYNTGTTTPPYAQSAYNTGTTTPPAYSQANYYAQSAYSSGGGGSPTPKKDKVDREKVKAVIDPNSAPILSIKKVAANLKNDEKITAGESVDYKITVTNDGGNAYDAEVFDVLVNPIGAVMNEQSWDLGTILPGESIDLTYTTEYKANTPSGEYKNTASVKAYLKDGMKEKKEAPLKVKDAVYTVEVKGVDLAVGNVAALAYFPGPNGKISALVAWETSKPSVSEAVYGMATQVSPYNKNAVNLGYQNTSFKFPTQKVKHAVILNGLEPGRTHAYRIHAVSDKFETTSREYLFTIPAVVARLTLAVPTEPTAMVAGASISVPVAPVVPAYVPTPAPAPKPAAVVPAPVVQPAAAPTVGGFVNKVKSGLFNFFH